MITLKPYINQQFNAQIWRLVIDSIAGLLFIETRNSDTREAKFSGIDLKSGNTNFTDFLSEEKWLTGIEGCYNGVLFLHGYQSAQSPVHKGIIALNSAKGHTLWHNYTHAIQCITVNGPIGYNTQLQPPKLLLLDSLNGSTIRQFDPDIDVGIDMEITVPELVELSDPALSLHVEGDIVGKIHYMEYNSFRIVSLHTLIKTELSQVLLIMQGSDLVYEDLLIGKIQKLQPEAFIMHRNQLIYIKNKVELRVLNL